MRKVSILRTQMVPMFVAVAREKGVDVGAALREFGVAQAACAEREMQLPLGTARALADALAEAVADPFLGLHTATWMPRGAYGLLEYSIRTAANVREGMDRLCRYSRLANDLVTYELEEDGVEARLSLSLPGEPLCVGRHANEMSIALIVRIMRESLTLPGWAPRRVWFAHPAPDSRAPLVEYFKTRRLEFGREQNGFAFDARELTLTLATSDSALHALLDEQARAVVAAKPRLNEPFTARLREQVRLALRQGTPRLEQVASALHMSPRTLQRRLHADGTQFNDLVDDIRRDLAELYLGREELAVGEVAFLLGYSDLRAFARAFRRWTGTTPTAFRTKPARR